MAACNASEPSLCVDAMERIGHVLATAKGACRHLAFSLLRSGDAAENDSLGGQ